jgi:hypothetical protein
LKCTQTVGRGRRQRAEPAIRGRALGRHAGEQRAGVAAHVAGGERRQTIGRDADRVRVGPLDRVRGLDRIALLDVDDVGEHVTHRPFPRGRRLVEQVVGQADEPAAQVTEGALGQGQDAARLGMRSRRRADDRVLRLRQRPVERVAHVQGAALKRPRPRECGFVQRRPCGEHALQTHLRPPALL